MHRRSVSDYASRYMPSSLEGAAAAACVSPGSGRGSLDDDAASGGGRGAAETYRRSIASLSYVAERDPAAMDEVVRVYTANSRDGLTAEDGTGKPAIAVVDHREADGREEEREEEEEEEEEELEGLAPTGAVMTRSVSAQSVRAVRQAQKLSQVLGTTKGEVRSSMLPSCLRSPESCPEAVTPWCAGLAHAPPRLARGDLGRRDARRGGEGRRATRSGEIAEDGDGLGLTRYGPHGYGRYGHVATLCSFVRAAGGKMVALPAAKAEHY